MMKAHFRSLLSLLVILVLVVSACAQAQPTATPVPTEPPPTEAPEPEEAEEVEAVEEEAEPTEEVEEVAEEEPTAVAMAEVTEEATEEAEMEMTEEAEEEATEEAEEPVEVTEEPTEVAMVEEPEAVVSETAVVSAGEALRLGLATILSGEGLVPLGADIQRGAELALAARPAVVIGEASFEVELDVQDDQCSAEGGQAVANRFVSDSSIVAVLGPTCSSACRAAGPIFDEAGYSSVSSSCTAVDLTAADTGFASFNRTTPNDDGQGRQAAAFIMNELGISRIATIHDGSPYGEGLVAVMSAEFAALGGEVVYADAVNVGDTDFRSLLDNVADAGAELIYFGGFPAEAARLSEQRADAGLEAVPFMGADGILTPEYVNLAGSAAEGTYASAPASVGAGYEAFLAQYEEVYGTEPTGAFHAYMYDATNLVLDAIEAVGEVDGDGNLVVDRAALRGYIRSYGADEPVAGLSGELSCDGSGECATGGIGFFRVVDGEFVPFGAEPMTEAAEEVEAPATIVNIAVDNEDFSTLVTALEAAGLVETLSSDGPFTVFAPTNDAFAALPEGTLEALLEDQAALTQVLLYHVHGGLLLAEDVVAADSVVTLEGSAISVSADDAGVRLNDTVNVVATDITGSNGVIHVIDAVLLPPAEETAAEEAEEPMEAAEETAMGPAAVVSAGEALRLGLATILSGEGLVPLGADIQRGAELALAARPAVVIGEASFEVELDVQDDQCSAEGGQAVANRFVSDSSIVAVLGPTCSSACRAAGPIFDEAGYSSVSSSCTAVDLTAADTGFASFNRTTPNDDGQGRQAAAFIMNELGISRIATIHDGSPYGEGLVAVMSAEFAALGGEVVYADAVNVGDTDFRSLLDNVADAGAELIYFGGFPAEAARLSEQRADAGLEAVPFMGADGILTPEYVNLAGSAAEGTYASAPASVGAGYEAFLAQYEEVYGTEPTGAFHAYMYDATNLVLDAIEAVGEVDGDGNLVVDRAALRGYIRSYGADEPVAGLSGELSCDGSGECATGGIGFFRVVDGEFVPFGAEASE